GDHQPRCSRIARHDPHAVPGVCRHQPRHRPLAVADRSAHPARLSTWVDKMSDIVALDRGRDAVAEQAPPATRVRGYWQSVLYRLQHDPVTLVFAAIVLSIVLAALLA